MHLVKEIIVIIFINLLFISCGPRLQIKIESRPSSAKVIFFETDTGLRTPAHLDKKFSAGNQSEEGLVSFEITLENQHKSVSGRILSWDGGFLFPVFIRRTESMDGSAWILTQKGSYADNVLTVKFPEPNNYYLVMNWWDKPRKHYSVDNIELNYTSNNDAFLLPIGKHSVDSERWNAVIEADEKYCVQLIEWGGSSEKDIYLCFQADQFSNIQFIDDKKVMKITHPGSVNVDGEQIRMIFENKNKRKCEITIQFEVYAFLHVRVSSS